MVKKPQPRAARPTDAAEIVHLGALMYAAVGSRTTPEWAVNTTQIVKARLQGNDLWGQVIDAPEGGLAACAMLNIVPRLPKPGARSPLVGYMQWVSTAPQHHRRGYARMVVTALLDQAKLQGIEVIELHATPLGMPLYEDFGFFVKDDNVAMTLVLNSKR